MRMCQKFRSETELAKVVVTALAADGWICYPEVQCNGADGRADIVAVNGILSMAIETKLSFSATVVCQAIRWIGFCNWSVVAIPIYIKSYSNRGHELLRGVIRDKGLGLLVCDEYGAKFEIKPKINRGKLRNMLREACRPEHILQGEAGQNGGGYYTPFKGTSELAVRYVKANPGCTIKELTENIDHHYSSPGSARSSIASCIDKGVIRGIKKEWNGNRWELWPDRICDATE